LEYGSAAALNLDRNEVSEMKPSLHSRLITAALILSAVSSGPAHSQKLLSDGIKDLANQIATNVSKEKKQKVAILPFRELDGKPTILGTYISEELVTDLFMIGGLDIIERTMLDRLIGELKLGQTGVIDPDTAKRVGKVAGVDAIVTGSITDLQSYVALNCRLIDAQTGHVFGAAQTKIVKDDEVRKIMGTALPGSEGESSQAAAPRPAAETGTKTTAKAVLQQQADSYIFELKRCNLSGKSLVCELLIINKREDRSIRFSPQNSRLIDEEGGGYDARTLTLGISPSSQFGASTETILATDIPVKARLTFEGIPPDTRRATLLEIKTGWGGEGVTIQFRNVPLTRP
jgi:TolB-like protein